jgi:uncharacterized membrane protein
MTARTLFLLNAVLLGLLVAASIAVWPMLPERLPVHFDLAGTPTRWARASAAAWFGLPALAALLGLLLAWLPRAARKNPSLWNVPEKALFVRLSPEGRAPFQEAMARIVAATAVLMTLTFAALQAVMYLTAAGRMTEPALLMSVAISLPVAAILWIAVRGSIAIAPAIRSAAGAEGIPPPRWR